MLKTQLVWTGEEYIDMDDKNTLRKYNYSYENEYMNTENGNIYHPFDALPINHHNQGLLDYLERNRVWVYVTEPNKHYYIDDTEYNRMVLIHYTQILYIYI